MKDDFPPKKEQKDSKNKSEQNPNLTSSPSAPKDFSHMNNLSPDKNSNFPSKENYFGVKASPTRGMGRTSSSGAHSPIFNYYSISSDGKEYCSSPKSIIIGWIFSICFIIIGLNEFYKARYVPKNLKEPLGLPLYAFHIFAS